MMAPLMSRPTTYWDYIRTESLLDQQHGLSTETELSNDEVLFIVVHQIDELWFKLIVRELVAVRNLFNRSRVPEQALAQATRGLRRIALLFKKVSEHFEVMETMTTRDYLGFRDKLSPASGFQSAQLREIEILMGLDDKVRIGFSEGSYRDALRNPDGTESAAYKRVSKRLADTPNVITVLHDWLWRTPIQGSFPDSPGDEQTVNAFIDAYLRAHKKSVEGTAANALAEVTSEHVRERLQKRYAAEIDGAVTFLQATDVAEDTRERTRRIRAGLVFIESYRELPLLAWPREVVESIVHLEQAMLVFRQRHARMVERVIGRRTGTGGSAGVDYLDETALRYRVFPELWAVRTILLRREALPVLENRTTYGFVTMVPAAMDSDL